jgi:hypothetical protein
VKKIEKYITNHHPPVRFYLEDLKELEGIFENNFDKYTIQDGEYEYKDLNELIDQGKSSIDHLKFSGEDKSSGKNYHEPKLYLEIEKSSLILSSYSVDDKIEGIIARVEKIINNRSRVNSLFKNDTFVNRVFFLYILLGAIIMIATGKVVSDGDNTIFHLDPIISFLVVGIFLLMILYIILISRKKSIIKLILKEQEQSFYSRNKDQIWLSIMSAIVGGIITLAIIYFTKNV